MKDLKKRLSLLLALLFSINFLGCGASTAWKVEAGDPAKSFWKDQVQYDYPVTYKKAKDSQGVEWEIAYMDVYTGKTPIADAKVLVLIHGKGAFGGYFGNVIKAAADSGLRVIVPDLPNYGKSIPGNIDKPLTRTLEDTRDAIYDVIVNQLGIKKATYLGHSLGGQWVMGYALKYPAAVEKIILESPGGLEEYPAVLKIPIGPDKVLEVPFFSPALVKDLETLKKVYAKNLADEYAKTPAFIQDWNYFKMKNPKTGAIIPGYFLNEDPYAKFTTDVRIQMISGNKKEYDNYVVTYIRDIYTLGIEVLKDDPNSITKRVMNIKVPILLIFGDKEPFIPVKFLSGLSDLKKEIIKPFYNALKAAGNAPSVKIYPNVGHFPHTDAAMQFSKDVVDFTTKGAVTDTVNVDSF